jgi:hypothetical protein
MTIIFCYPLSSIDERLGNRRYGKRPCLNAGFIGYSR